MLRLLLIAGLVMALLGAGTVRTGLAVPSLYIAAGPSTPNRSADKVD